MMWCVKNSDCVVFQNVRKLESILCDGRHFTVSPDKMADVTELPYPDGRFRMVVFDPLHLIHAGKDSFLVVKYGVLAKDYKTFLKKAFKECFRVLEDRPGIEKGREK